MAKYKPKERELSREQLQRRVDLVRGLMKIGARQMVDLEHTKGRLLSFDTEKGTVRALVYGFYDPNVKPLLVNIHGSGFVMGSAAMDDPFMMQFVHKCGVKVISIDYPLSPDVMFPTALEQCYALVRYAKDHAKELRIDGDRIMLMGHSAGGNFCAAIGLMENPDPKLGVKGIILDYPPTDLSIDAYDKPLPKGCLPPRMCRIFDAVGEIENIHCPTFIIGGADDKIVGVEASYEMKERIPGSQLYIYDGLGHAAYEEAPDFYQRVFDFLENGSGEETELTLQKRTFSPERDGFYGVWYPNPEVKTNRAMIIMLGDSSDDRMAVSGAKWLHRQGVNVLAMSPDQKDYGHHNYPMERFGKAIEFLDSQGCSKIGIIGASTTGMMALLAASYYPQISLTIAISPPDFVMEGFYQDGKDGAHERPGDNESSVSWMGTSLPYLPYAYRHPEYWQKIKEESKAGGNMIASRRMFDESERRHPLQECEKIKIEKIHGKVICIGAEDDCLWNTCRYIRRMQKRISKRPHDCTFEAWTYKYGTHFAFPESMLKSMLPVGSSLLVKAAFRSARRHPKECREMRMNLDRRLTNALREW